jgi:hypothetical protein
LGELYGRSIVLEIDSQEIKNVSLGFQGKIISEISQFLDIILNVLVITEP